MRESLMVMIVVHCRLAVSEPVINTRKSVISTAFPLVTANPASCTWLKSQRPNDPSCICMHRKFHQNQKSTAVLSQLTIFNMAIICHLGFDQ